MSVTAKLSPARPVVVRCSAARLSKWKKAAKWVAELGQNEQAATPILRAIGTAHGKHDSRGRRGHPPEEPLDGCLHLGVHRLDEAGEVGRAAVLRGDDVGDGGEADALWKQRRRRAEQAEPLLGEDDGEQSAQASMGLMWPRPGYGSATMWHGRRSTARLASAKATSWEMIAVCYHSRWVLHSSAAAQR